MLKTAEAGKETTGGQQHLSLPRLRVSIQPAAVAAVSAPQHGHGIWIPRRNSLADARPLVLRQAQDEWELPKDGSGPGQRWDRNKPPKDGADDLRGPESRETEGRPAPPLPSHVAFAREVLGVQLWAKQEEVLNALTTHRRVAVKAGNGLGKGFCAAVAVLWFIHTHQDAAVALAIGSVGILILSTFPLSCLLSRWRCPAAPVREVIRTNILIIIRRRYKATQGRDVRI